MTIHAGRGFPVAVCTRPALTPREFEVVRLMALGQTWEQVQAALGITRQTVMHHRQHALYRNGGGNFLTLLRELGWLRVPQA